MLIIPFNQIFIILNRKLPDLVSEVYIFGNTIYFMLFIVNIAQRAGSDCIELAIRVRWLRKIHTFRQMVVHELHDG